MKDLRSYCVRVHCKKVRGFPVPIRDVTYQTPPGKWHPVWKKTVKSGTFFIVYAVYYECTRNVHENMYRYNIHEHEEWNNTELGANICICPFESAVSLADWREYGMIYRWPGFLAVEWFSSSPSPPLLLRSSSCLSFSVYLCVAVRAYWRERGGRELKLYAGKKAWSSTNHSILYGHLFQGFSLLFLLDDRRIRIRIRIHNFDWRIRIRNQIRIRNTDFMYIHLKSTKCCSDKRDIACEQSNTLAVFLTETSAISAQSKS